MVHKNGGSFLKGMSSPRGQAVAEFDKFSAVHGRQQHLAQTHVVAAFRGAEGAEINRGTVPIG